MWQLLVLLIAVDPFDLQPGSPEIRRWHDFLVFERADQTRMALTNARHYVRRFRQIFLEEGLPEDLVWIALIESSFRAVATSPTGAQGMYQFKSPTARAFGLAVTQNVDERNEPLLAARAAARYLVYLRQRFKSWDLVLAAYNLGEGDLRRAMKRHHATTWEEVKPHVRPATRDYVGKVKAAALIGNAYMATWTEDTEPLTHYMVKKGDTLYTIARGLDIEVDSIVEANELINHRIFPGQLLVIPAK